MKMEKKDNSPDSHTVHLYDNRRLSNFLDGIRQPIGHLICFGSKTHPISIVAFNRNGKMVGLWTQDDKTWTLPDRQYYCDGNGLKELVDKSNDIIEKETVPDTIY